MEIQEFNNIIVPMRGNLFSHALKLTNSHDRAEDLVQDTMLKL
ncbi:MAG: sigma factor [Prevotellaceae bacterium]|nr:sigma factor [Prevotellaceae bacterium]